MILIALQSEEGYSEYYYHNQILNVYTICIYIVSIRIYTQIN